MDNHASVIFPLLSINYISSHHPIAYTKPVKNTHARERKVIRYHQLIPAGRGKTLLRYFKHITSGAYQQCMLKFLKRMRKVPP